MGHFKVAMLDVHSLKPFIAMSTLKRGLHKGYFYFSLSKRFPRDLPQLLAHAEKYVNAKEGMVKKKKEKREHKRPKENRFLPSPQPMR